MTKLVIFIAAFSLALTAQYPYPPNYPAGPYPPMGGATIPRPGHHKSQKKSSENQQILNAEGRTVSNDGKKLVVETQDGRTLTMSITPDTKFLQGGSDIPASKIVPRTTVHVEAAEDDEAYLTAVRVELLKEASAEVAGAPGGNAEERPTILDAPVEAPDRPILRRGKPNDPDLVVENEAKAKPTTTPKSNSNSVVDFTIDSDTATKPLHTRYDDLIAQTRQWVFTFTQGLPNYLCEQDTTRYIEQSRATGWEAQDVVTAKVVYEDGHESYRDITVGGKKTNKSMMELGGQTSTGEFASMLYSLFNPARQTQFKFHSSANLGDTETAVYDFKVTLPHSDWTITVGGQTLRPAYSGAVWIDKKTAVVRRLEMQADNIPQDFPMSDVESAVDYDMIPLGGREFLLPVHAENLSCQRGSTICAKNTIDFRNYHKFEGESTITFEK